MDGWSVGGVELLHAGHKTGLMCTTVLSFDVTITYFCIRPGFTDGTISVLHVFG
jgi:hypothetical protein